ncbi:MAG: hypothetical protein RL655_2158, partial [Pseudomonadota bacterium]
MIEPPCPNSKMLAMFKALLLEKNDNFQASLQSVSVEQLPPGDVTVAVAYS